MLVYFFQPYSLYVWYKNSIFVLEFKKKITMAIVYNKYSNNRDHTWYDSSNVVYSVCYDANTEKKVVKIVFKQGRTYLYRDVDVNDYLLFKTAESTGKSVNDFIIKKYKSVRLPDTDLGTIEALKDDFINENKITEEAFTNLVYHLEINNDTKEFRLKLNDKTIFEGIENQISIVRLLKSMNINYSISEMEGKITNEEDFCNE